MTDADRAKAAERAAYEVYLALPDAALDALTPHEERAAITAIAAALAEARAPYDRLTADLRELAEEWEAIPTMGNDGIRLGRMVARLRAVVAATEEGHMPLAAEPRTGQQ